MSLPATCPLPWPVDRTEMRHLLRALGYHVHVWRLDGNVARATTLVGVRQTFEFDQGAAGIEIRVTPGW